MNKDEIIEWLEGIDTPQVFTEELKQDIERITIKAAQDAENMGNPGSIPASVRDLINEIRESKIAWEEFVFTTLQSRFPDDYTYRRPNKKYLDQGLYLPTMESTRVKRFVFAFDTSGSVSRDELIDYYSECNFLINHFKPESVYLMSSDCAVAEVVELEEGETIEDGFYFKGGGGTSFKPVFEHLEENNIEVDQLIYFSDMLIILLQLSSSQSGYGGLHEQCLRSGHCGRWPRGTYGRQGSRRKRAPHGTA